MQQAKSAGKTLASKSQLRLGLLLTGLKRKKKERNSSPFLPCTLVSLVTFRTLGTRSFISRAAIEWGGGDSGRLHTKKA